MNTPPPPRRFILYARKSTDREDKQVQSIDDQIRLATERANREGFRIVETLTESRSAKRAGVRAGFARMVAMLEKGQADAVITWHPDRLARNAVDGGWVIDLLDRNKLKAIVFTSGYSFESTPEGKMMLSLIFSQAKYQVDKLSVDVMRGMKSKRDKGDFPHRAPEGYINERVSRTVVADPDRFPLLRRAMGQILAGGATVPQALRTLNDTSGYRTKPTRRNAGIGSPLPRATLYGILKNPFYAGLCRGRQGLYRGTHPPLLSVEEFYRLRRLLGDEDARAGDEEIVLPPAQRRSKHDFAYAGLMRCGRCGCAITATRSKGHIYYHCTNMRRVCDRKGVREEELEQQIAGYLEGITVSASFQEQVMEQMRRHFARTTREDISLRKVAGDTAGRTMTELGARLEKLLDLRLADMITDAQYLSRKATLTLEQERHREKMEAYGGIHGNAERSFDVVRKGISFCTLARDYFARRPDPAGKRLTISVLAAGGSEVILTGKRLLLEPKALFTELAGSSRRIGTFKPGEIGSGKEKKTPACAGVCSGSPDETMFKQLTLLLSSAILLDKAFAYNSTTWLNFYVDPSGNNLLPNYSSGVSTAIE